ncbi:MAG TPA: nitroreductase/quinone reductase family protein [Miltoncostaeaceae bacterium]|jgi:deazaflavin-dependent oxidoreductase (nitroreductase family)|nr:nitroreductase/quinone reductase family protein [Miltoncostaeaceae bacterium]
MGLDFTAWNAAVIDEFRANGGRVEEFADRPLVILHTTGAKSGEERLNPLMHLVEDGGIVVFASRAGEDKHPDWYHNVRADPQVEVELGDRTVRARAVEVTGEERDRLYAEMKAKYPQFADYEAATSRVIPVVRLRYEE